MLTNAVHVKFTRETEDYAYLQIVQKFEGFSILTYPTPVCVCRGRRGRGGAATILVSSLLTGHHDFSLLRQSPHVSFHLNYLIFCFQIVFNVYNRGLL